MDKYGCYITILLKIAEVTELLARRKFKHEPQREFAKVIA
jgi:hypothetical protein